MQSGVKCGRRPARHLRGPDPPHRGSCRFWRVGDRAWPRDTHGFRPSPERRKETAHPDHHSSSPTPIGDLHHIPHPLHTVTPPQTATHHHRLSGAGTSPRTPIRGRNPGAGRGTAIPPTNLPDIPPFTNQNTRSNINLSRVLTRCPCQPTPSERNGGQLRGIEVVLTSY